MAQFVAHRMSGTEDGNCSEMQGEIYIYIFYASLELTQVSFKAIAYQREPTFRVVLPSGQQLGYRHCDADYHHPPVSC